MKEKFLPIGTVLLLKNGTKKIMITGYLPVSKDENKTVYDYSACLFPEGVISVNQTAVFNHDQIAEVIQEGYSNEETENFMGVLKDYLSKNNPADEVSTPSESNTPAETPQEENKEPETLEPPKLDDIDIPVAAETTETQVQAPEAPVVETPSIESAPAALAPEVAPAPIAPITPEAAPASAPNEVEMPAPAEPAQPAPTAEPEPATVPMTEETPVDPASISNMSDITPMGVDSIKPFSE